MAFCYLVKISNIIRVQVSAGERYLDILVMYNVRNMIITYAMYVTPSTVYINVVFNCQKCHGGGGG